MRAFRKNQLGEGQLGCIVGLLVFLAAIFVAYKMVPTKVKAAELRQEIVDNAKAAGMRNDSQIQKAVLAKAQELGLPLQKEDLSITRGGNIIKIDAKYTVVVEFPGYTYHWNFHHHAENPIF